MKASVYIGHRGGGFGGAENTISAVASALANRFEVELVTHDPEMSLERFLARTPEVAGDPLKLSLRFVAEDPAPPQKIFFGRTHMAHRCNAAVSEGADLFFNLANRVPPFCHARAGIMRVFFPFHEPRHLQRTPGFRGLVRRHYHRLEWERRWETYAAVLANSAYTAEWVRRRWGVGCEVVHPPVDTAFPRSAKEPIIVSVGRFALWGNAKKQAEMLRFFAGASDLRRAGWRYRTIGGSGEGSEDEAFLARIRAAAPAGAEVLADLPRAALKQELGRAMIFWHAAGWGEDPETNPGAFEHFGQSTVEAMAAGCVPVVIRGGGQPEIVEHGENGFLWDTPGELLEFTRLLAGDDRLREKMAEAARRRAGAFGRDDFVGRIRSIVGRLPAVGETRP